MKDVTGHIFLFLFFGSVICVREFNFPYPVWNPRRNECDVNSPKGRVDWIVYVRDSDYGWRDETHRANIALAVNKYGGKKPGELEKMDLQLEVELTGTLFRNSTLPQMHYNDLAFFIHALIARKKNPRNFHGVDLVADLLHHVRISESGRVHPFLVLALCNAHAVEFDHLMKIRNFLLQEHDDRISNQDVDNREAQLKAIAIKAFTCAGTIDRQLKKFSSDIDVAINYLLKNHSKTDGTFGNVYSTSLAVQALIAREATKKENYDWEKRKALEYLEKEACIDVNLIKAYYIEMALNADKFNFIKDLYEDGTFETPGIPSSEDSHSVTYTIKKGLHPEIFYSVTVKVPRRLNFYEIMLITAKENDRFNFSAYNDVRGLPKVYKISGTPNDPEENLFWRICRRENHSHRTPFNDSPAKLFPKKDEHITFWYRNADCPLK